MACIIYVTYNGAEIRAGRFKNRQQAETYWARSKEIFRQRDGKLGNPIYVETKKGRGD